MRRCGAAAGGQLCGPLPGAGEGAEGVQVAAGGAAGGGEPGPVEAPPGDGTAGSGRATTQGAPTPGSELEIFLRSFEDLRGVVLQTREISVTLSILIVVKLLEKSAKRVL